MAKLNNDLQQVAKSKIQPSLGVVIIIISNHGEGIYLGPMRPRKCVQCLPIAPEVDLCPCPLKQYPKIDSGLFIGRIPHASSLLQSGRRGFFGDFGVAKNW